MMKRVTGSKWRIGLITAFMLAAVHSHASFNINLIFGTGLTPAQQGLFTTAADTWESLITGYQPGVSITGLTIDASAIIIDGTGGVLGQGRPRVLGLRNQGGFWLPTTGLMEFDIDDLSALESDGSFLSVIQHEMAHVMGFGTLWTLNNVYDGNGHYTGANAVAAARTEFGVPNAPWVPVELGGGAGTADSHWDEIDDGVCCTGFLSSQGDATFELMTGWLNMPTFISQTTIQSFVDIGYSTAPIPEPETYALMLAGLGLMGFIARRRKRQVASA